MAAGRRSARLADCREHGPGDGSPHDPQLLLVEGDSALGAVRAVRDERHQAVLALQGKPLNALRAPAARVVSHPAWRDLAAALGLASPDAPPPPTRAALRFARIVMLFDPDADGIHIGALVTLYLARWQPWWLDEDRLQIVDAPLAVVQLDGAHPAGAAPRWAASTADAIAQRDAWARELDAVTAARLRIQATRGLAGLDAEVLRACVEPARRRVRTLRRADADAIARQLGPRAGATGHRMPRMPVGPI